MGLGTNPAAQGGQVARGQTRAAVVRAPRCHSASERETPDVRSLSSNTRHSCDGSVGCEDASSGPRDDGSRASAGPRTTAHTPWETAARKLGMRSSVAAAGPLRIVRRENTTKPEAKRLLYVGEGPTVMPMRTTKEP